MGVVLPTVPGLIALLWMAQAPAAGGPPAQAACQVTGTVRADATPLPGVAITVRAGGHADPGAICLVFFRNGVRVFETPTTDADTVNEPARHAAVFRFDVPAATLQPGRYTCQVNVVDDAAGTFAFPRFTVYVTP